MVEMVGLQGHGHKRPSALSGGQQQRVALARALAYEPPVLLLDEPFSALDKNLRGQMQDEVRRLHREIGTTFVFVTHDQEEALALSTRVAIFDKGRLQQLGAPRDVYERPANRFVAEFLGDINLLPLEASGVDGTARFEGQPVRVPTGGAGIHLAVRPEHMRLHLAPPGDCNAIGASLRDLVYLGAETRLGLRTAGGTDLTLLLPTADLPEGLAPGTSVWATWPETRGLLL
jgi:putative spermidine/putrescine transport system ATP-binding protein